MCLDIGLCNSRLENFLRRIDTQRRQTDWVGKQRRVSNRMPVYVGKTKKGPGPWLKTCNVSGYWWPLKLKARKLLVTSICILLLSKYDVPALHLGPKRGPRRRPRQLRGRRRLLPRRCHQVVLPARLAAQRRHQLPAFGRGLQKSPPLLPSPRSTSVMLAQEWQETRPRLELV